MSYDEENILVRPIPYKILRAMHLADGGSYHVQLNLKAGFDQDTAEEVIKALTDANLLYAVDNTDPQLYDVNYSRIESLWKKKWSEEIDDVPATPVHFATFIEYYVKSYLNSEEVSTIESMLVSEFFMGLNQRNERVLPQDYEELLHRLSEQYEGKRETHEHIQHGLNYTD